MFSARWLVVVLAAVIGIALVGSALAEEKAASKPTLPEAVAKALKAEFPKGEIVKVDEEKENGVTVFDIEFKDGDAKREADIAADGTILEVELVVEAKQVPEAAMKGIVKAAEGATIKQLARIEIRCEAKDGHVVKLDKPKLNYEAELTKGDQAGEVTVDEQGNVVEAVKWEKKEEKKAEK